MLVVDRFRHGKFLRFVSCAHKARSCLPEDSARSGQSIAFAVGLSAVGNSATSGFNCSSFSTSSASCTAGMAGVSAVVHRESLLITQSTFYSMVSQLKAA